MMSRTLGGRSDPDGMEDIEAGRQPVRAVDAIAHPAVLIKARRFIFGFSKCGWLQLQGAGAKRVNSSCAGSTKSSLDCINPVRLLNDYSGQRSFFLLRRLSFGYTYPSNELLDLMCETMVS